MGDISPPFCFFLIFLTLDAGVGFWTLILDYSAVVVKDPIF